MRPSLHLLPLPMSGTGGGCRKAVLPSTTDSRGSMGSRTVLLDRLGAEFEYRPNRAQAKQASSA